MSAEIKQASTALSEAVRRNSVDKYCLPEACHEINDASRELIEAVLNNCDQCFLVTVNRYDKENVPIFRKIETMDDVYTFGGSFVVDRHDPVLESLLRAREEAPYTGTAADLVRIQKIHERADEIGAEILIWT